MGTLVVPDAGGRYNDSKAPASPPSTPHPTSARSLLYFAQAPTANVSARALMGAAVAGPTKSWLGVFRDGVDCGWPTIRQAYRVATAHKGWQKCRHMAGDNGVRHCNGDGFNAVSTQVAKRLDSNNTPPRTPAISRTISFFRCLTLRAAWAPICHGMPCRRKPFSAELLACVVCLTSSLL